MPWRHAPKFVTTHLTTHGPGDSTREAFLFLFLTAARCGEVRGATWDEFDLHAGVWSISDIVQDTQPPAARNVQMNISDRHSNETWPRYRAYGAGSSWRPRLVFRFAPTGSGS